MSDTVVIKKYANRRLYNTETSTYVTLEDLAELLKEGRNLEVVDAKSGEDLTRQVLTQIIFEAESRGDPVLPLNFLRQIARFYDDSLQHILPQYLEMSMAQFVENKDKLKENGDKMFGPFNPFGAFEDMEKAQKMNMELLQNTFKLFNPFYAAASEQHQTAEPQQSDDKDRRIAQLEKELAELKAQMKNQ